MLAGSLINLPMANPRGNEATLTKWESKWNSGSTRTIRVPVVLADQVLTYARQIDQGEDINSNLPADLNINSLSQVIEILEEVKQTPRNNFSKERKAQLQKAIELLNSLSQVNDVN